MMTPDRIAEIDRRLACGFVDDARETIRSLLADRAALLARAEAAEGEAAALMGLAIGRDELADPQFAAVVGWEEYFDADAGGPEIGGDSIRPRLGRFAGINAARAAVRKAAGLPAKDAAG